MSDLLKLNNEVEINQNDLITIDCGVPNVFKEKSCAVGGFGSQPRLWKQLSKPIDRESG